MSFNLRFLSKESIKSFAENDFSSFERYMIYSDSYVIESGWANEIHSKFVEANKEERKSIHQSILNKKI